MDAGICLGFIQEVADGFALLTKTYNLAAEPCVCEKATTDELIRVTLKFINEHPEHLADGGADVVWHAMVAFYPCPAK